MSKAKHTPGPWVIGRLTDLETSLRHVAIAQVGVTQGAVCLISAESNFDAQDAANAHLIAAAPDLLAACEAVANNNGGPIDGIVGDRLKGEQEQWVEDSYVMVRREDFDALCAAIAKATSE